MDKFEDFPEDGTEPLAEQTTQRVIDLINLSDAYLRASTTFQPLLKDAGWFIVDALRQQETTTVVATTTLKLVDPSNGKVTSL